MTFLGKDLTIFLEDHETFGECLERVEDQGYAIEIGKYNFPLDDVFSKYPDVKITKELLDFALRFEIVNATEGNANWNVFEKDFIRNSSAKYVLHQVEKQLAQFIMLGKELSKTYIDSKMEILKTYMLKYIEELE